MHRGLNWKWIGLGVLIMFGLTFAAGIVVSLLWGEEMQAVAEGQTVSFSAGQMAVVTILSLLSFAVGGYIVGVRSPGRTILEPGLSAAIAVGLSLLVGGNFTLGGLLIGGALPFIGGLFGGWLGERRQGTV